MTGFYQDPQGFGLRQAGKPYRPSNGTEGEIFYGMWCAHCTRDAAFREDYINGDGCPILALTQAVGVEDPSYPKEWIYNSEGTPTCTAFDETGDKQKRCDGTMEMSF